MTRIFCDQCDATRKVGQRMVEAERDTFRASVKQMADEHRRRWQAHVTWCREQAQLASRQGEYGAEDAFLRAAAQAERGDK